jgi:hypothetical protein
MKTFRGWSIVGTYNIPVVVRGIPCDDTVLIVRRDGVFAEFRSHQHKGDPTEIDLGGLTLEGYVDSRSSSSCIASGLEFCDECASNGILSLAEAPFRGKMRCSDCITEHEIDATFPSAARSRDDDDLDREYPDRGDYEDGTDL